MAVPDRSAPQAVGLVLGAITSLQFGAALGATLFDEAGAAGAALLRIALAALIIGAVVRPRLRGRTREELRTMALFGLALGTMNLCIYEAFARIPLGMAVTIEFLGPLGLAAALSRRRLDLLWVAMAAAGVVLLADPGGGTDPVGVAFALAAGAGWAAYILLAQRAGRQWAGADGVAAAMAVAVLVPLVPGVVGGGEALLSGEVLLVGAAVALLSSVLPYTMETEALRTLPAQAFGVLMSVEPAVAAVAGLVVLDQALSLLDCVAISLVVAASAGATRAPVPVADA